MLTKEVTFPMYVVENEGDSVEFTESFKLYLDAKFAAIEKTIETHSIESEKTTERLRNDISDLYEKHRATTMSIRDAKDAISELFDAKVVALNERVSLLDQRQSKDEGGSAMSRYITNAVIAVMGILAGIAGVIIAGK